MRSLKITILIAIATALPALPAHADENANDDVTLPMSDLSLIDEVMTSASSPRAYDWRRGSWDLELGLVEVDERTVFNSGGYHFGVGFPSFGGWRFRTGIRHITIQRTPSGDLIDTTNFRQSAQPTRYEVFGLVDWSLVEGRVFTRLSPYLGDSEHVLALEFGGHYTHPTPDLIPQMTPVVQAVPGQNPVYSKIVAHIGLNYTLYLPSGFGLFMAPAVEVPTTKLDGALFRWFTFTAGTIFSFGGKP